MAGKYPFTIQILRIVDYCRKCNHSIFAFCELLYGGQPPVVFFGISILFSDIAIHTIWSMLYMSNYFFYRLWYCRKGCGRRRQTGRTVPERRDLFPYGKAPDRKPKLGVGVMGSMKKRILQGISLTSG